MIFKRIIGTTLILTACFNASCIYIHTNVRSMDVQQVSNASHVSIHRITKIQLNDGSLVIFEEGFVVRQDKIAGKGKKYDMLCNEVTEVSEVSMEDVKNIIYYEKVLQPFPLIFAIPTILFGFIKVIELIDES